MTAPNFDNDVNIKPIYGQRKNSAPLTQNIIWTGRTSKPKNI